MRVKRLIVFSALLAWSLTWGSDLISVVTKENDLPKYVGRRVTMTGVYHDPGKGDRRIDCSFVSLRIEDYSFTKKDSHGYLVDLLKDGDKITFEGKLRYSKGGRSLVVTHPIRQEALPPIQVIDGREYYVYPPEYSICEARVLQLLKPQHDASHGPGTVGAAPGQ